MNMTLRWLAPVLCIGMIAMAPAPGYGKDEKVSEEIAALKKTGKAFSEIAKKAMPAVVFITVEKTIEGTVAGGQFNDPFGFFGDEFMERFFGQRGGGVPRQFRTMGQGSGFLISKDGYILTNNHVVGDADKITVKLHDGREVEAKRVGADPRSEVALIKIEGNDFPFVKMGDSTALEIGEWVIAIGTPFGLSETLTVGVVSAKGRSNIGIAEYEDFIQTDAAINPGNSGGPLLNIDGDVIGINTAIFSQSGGYMGIGFAIPINMAKAIKEQLVKSGRVTRGYVGIQIRDMTDDLAEQFGLKKAEGVLVEGVLDGSAGAKAGLLHGDIVVRIDGRKVESVAGFKNAVASQAPGTKLNLAILRDGKEKDVAVQIGELEDTAATTAKSQEIFKKLGMALQALTPELAGRLGLDANSGLLVAQVEVGGQAARIGIRPGHIIESVGRNHKVTTADEFLDAVRTTAKGGKILVRVRGERHSQYVTMSIE